MGHHYDPGSTFQPPLNVVAGGSFSRHNEWKVVQEVTELREPVHTPMSFPKNQTTLIACDECDASLIVQE
jgi:hypothetical protein